MATQDNEEGKGGGGGLSNLKTVGGGFVKAANLAQRVSGGVIKANPIIMTAGTGAAVYSGIRRHKDSEAGVPEEDQYPQYNPYGYETAALRKGFDAVSHIVRKVTGREGVKEPSEFPQETDQLEAVTEEPEARNERTRVDPSGRTTVDYSLTNGSSEDTMLQPMDEGVGLEEKYDHYGFPSDYEGEYDNADAEMRDLLENPESRKKFGSAKELTTRRDYLNDRLDEAKTRKSQERTAGAQNPNFQSASEELNYIREHGFEGSNQEKADYIRQLQLKIEKERRARTSSAGGSTRTTASRQGWDPDNDRGIKGALALSAVPQDRAQELQNGRITLQGRSYDVVGNAGDKFLVPSPDQPDYSRLS